MLIDMGFHVDIYDKFFAPEEIYINNTYDLITATEVMEHLRDPLPTIKLLKKHTNKKGIIAIMTAFHPLDETKFMEWWYRRDKTHISFLKLAAYDDKNIIVLQKYD
jgi:2-polyprenyl-3-methyl-5-hydroxy-6-metoxy-1,4-benzoquinol methylase